MAAPGSGGPTGARGLNAAPRRPAPGGGEGEGEPQRARIRGAQRAGGQGKERPLEAFTLKTTQIR